MFYSSSLFEIFTNNIDKIAFRIGDFEIAWYGIIIFIGFVVAALAGFLKAHFWYRIPTEPILYYLIMAIPLSIIGARVWAAAIGEINIVDFFNFRNGGMAIQGGVMAAGICGLIYFPLILRSAKYNVKTCLNDEVKVKRISTFVYSDCIIPCILIGQVIGRWGNFVNAEVFGEIATPEQLSWLKSFMPEVYKGMIINGQLRQPLFLYESFANFIIFVTLYAGAEFVSFRKAGDIGALYFVLYGIVRTIMEPLRAGNFSYITSLITSILMIVFGIGFIIYNHLYLNKHRDQFIVFTMYKAFQLPFKKIYYLMSSSYKKEIDRYDSDWKNWGNPKPLKLKRTNEEMMYYNGQ
ncbi:MAG: prolipoprotein diacylglyceryl transferase [Mycoplasmoidaceae bacterium]